MPSDFCNVPNEDFILSGRLVGVRHFGLSMATLLVGCLVAGASEKAVAFRGAEIRTAAGAVHRPGVLVVLGGKIADVGPMDAVAVPKDAQVHDLSGKVIIPGLVDTHSHLGVYSRPSSDGSADGNEMTGAVQSGVRALDAANPDDPGIKMANAGGLTAGNIMPGSGNVIGGQTVYVKYRGRTIEEMRVAPEVVVGGLKMANGENPKRAYGSKNQPPSTRMKVAALQRAEFLKARDYQQKWAGYRKALAEGKEASPPPVDLSLEPLVEVLERKRTVHFHSHRADDLLTAVRISEEFGFELVLQHGTEAYKIAGELAKRKIPVSMTIVDAPGGKPEVVGLIEECAAELVKAGVRIAINTDDPVTDSRFLLRTAAIAIRGGLSEDHALEALTIQPARMLHLDHRIGTLAKGKDADFVVLSGPPFSVYTRVLETYIDGERVFNAADPADRAYQTGGFLLPPGDRSLVATDDPAKTAVAPLKAVPPPDPPKQSEAKKDDVVVILAGRIRTAAGPPIETGAIVVRGGKIAAVGPQADVPFPADAMILSAAEVTPGLIDAQTIVPLDGVLNVAADLDADEKSDPNQADLRVLDAFHPFEPLLAYLLSEGVTMVHATPGRANVIAGLTGIFRTHGRNAEEMKLRFPQAMLINLGVAPKEAYAGKKPGTRMGTAAILRSALAEAGNHARKQKSAKEDARPGRDLRLESLGLLLERKIPAYCCAQRSDDLLTAARLLKEFNVDGALVLAGEGYRVLEPLKAAGMPVIVHPTMQRVGSLETIHTFLGNAAALANGGVPIAICSGAEGYVPKCRVVRHEAAVAMVHGLGADRALRAVTIDAAKILKMDDRFGSIEVGKVADLVLYDRDPFEYASHVEKVLIDGKVVYDRKDRRQESFARRLWLSAADIPCCLW